MKNTSTKSLTPRRTAYRRTALFAAVCAVVLGLGAAGLLSVRAQEGSNFAAQRAERLLTRPQANGGTVSENVHVNWQNPWRRRRQTFDDYLRSFRGDERMSARVMTTRDEGGGQPQGVIVIFNGHGGVLACIGRPSACKEFLH